MSRGFRVCFVAVVSVAMACGEDDSPFDAFPPIDGDGGMRDGATPMDDGAVDPDSDVPRFCDDVTCGAGVCVEASRRCNCDSGYVYDADARTCVADACGGACTPGEVCDSATRTCVAPRCTPDRTVGEFVFCFATEGEGYDVVVRYQGAGTLDLDASVIRLNGATVNLRSAYDPATQTFSIRASGLEPSKYSYLFRMRRADGSRVQPLFIPMWIGPGLRFADFTWNDSVVYQIFTDRFDNGDPSNDLDNSAGDLARVTDRRSQWQGGDFAGITRRIRDGYFERMGVNTLWISSPILNSHNSQPGVWPDDPVRYGSYHSYHPIATGHTDVDDFGYPNPIESAFGTPEELHELVEEAHRRGIRVMPDFVPNHVQREANIFARHPEWFFEYNACHDRWDVARIGCWFTYDMPDFDYGANPAAITAVVEHAIWLVQEFNFDAYRLDALKHMDDAFARALKREVVARLETTVDDHDLSVEPTIFYMVGESLGRWARYHVRADMVQGQVDEEYYEHARDALLNFRRSLRNLADFSIANDRAYLEPRDTFPSGVAGRGGYPGAIMGNFFGNHDQPRALTEAQCGRNDEHRLLTSDRFSHQCVQWIGGPTRSPNDDAYRRLRLAQTFLMTSPYNVPMIYQGDEIGTPGGEDPDNRAMHRFDGLSAEEQASLANMQRLGELREAHAPLRRGVRANVHVEDWFWVYRVSHDGQDVYVAINRDNPKTWSPPSGYSDALGNCSGGTVPTLASCVFVRD
ncbi:MAG: hypothetical protein KF901_24250 [Myxococcales bacterium]|nr:hypothetical protein [Myxococcales bacterium]